MLFLILNLHLSVGNKGSNENQPGKLLLKTRSNLSSIRLLEVDSVKCLASYTAAVTALNGVTARSTLHLKGGESEATSAINTFKAECALKVTTTGACKT
jgi:hypothetical protein